MDTYASITGDLALYDKRGKICQWIDDIDAIDNQMSRSPTLVTEDLSPTHDRDIRALKSGGSEGDAIHVRLAPAESVFESEDLDLDDDFFAEAAQQALEKGKSSFASQDFKSASAYLKEGLTMAKELSSRPAALSDTWELRRMLGICAFNIDSPAEAEDALLSVLANAPKNAILSEQQRLQVSETTHLLAQVDVKLSKLDQAYRYCEYCLRGRRRVLGKNHEQSYESLALMARILELQKNDIRAEFFVGMIPEHKREALIKKYEELKVPEIVPAAKRQDSLSPTSAPQTPPKSAARGIEKIKAPPIPERSPSRSGADLPKSVMAVRQEGGRARSSSALSGRVSALSGPVSAPPSEAGEGVTPFSVSGSPQLSRAEPSPALQPSAMRQAGVVEGHSTANSVHLLPAPFMQSPVENRPDSKRTLSGRSANTLPAITEPPAAGPPQTAHGSQRSLSDPAVLQQHQPGQERAQAGPQPPELYPRPLRPGKQPFVSELPGDSEFSTPRSPRSIASVPASIDGGLKPQVHERNSVFTVSSLRRSPNIALPEQEDTSSPPPQQPPQPAPQPESLSPPQTGTQQQDTFLIPATPQSTRREVEHTRQVQEDQPAQREQQEAYPSPPAPKAAGSTSQIASRSATQLSLFPTTSATFPAQPIRPDHDPQAQRRMDFAYPPQRQQEQQYHAYSETSHHQREPSDRPSFTSSTYSYDPNSFNHLRSAHATEVKLVPVGLARSETPPPPPPEKDKTRRKTSLLKVFRSHTGSGSTMNTNKPTPPEPIAESSSAASTRNLSLTYNGIRLSKKDIDSIKNSSEHLTDNAIDFWQEYLEHEMLRHNPRYVLMRPMRTHLLVQACTSPTAPTSESLKPLLPDFTATQHVFLPLKSPSRSHWSLLLLSPHDDMACHYDPYQSKSNNRNLASQVTSRVSTYINKPLQFIDVPDTPEQVKEQDCAVFMCFFMQHLITKLATTHVSQKVDASMKCKTIEAKTGRKVILKAVEARRRSKESGALFEE